MVPLHTGVECGLLGASDMEHELSNECRAGAPRRQDRVRAMNAIDRRAGELRRGGLFGVQRGNPRSDGKPADLWPPHLALAPAGNHSGADEVTCRAKVAAARWEVFL
jgi:hypothetical protein